MFLGIEIGVTLGVAGGAQGRDDVAEGEVAVPLGVDRLLRPIDDVLAGVAVLGEGDLLAQQLPVAGDQYDGDGADLFFGTIEGNGGNWFELLVVDDLVDMRGWQLVWEEDELVGDT